MFRGHVISAVFKRNLLSYFSGILGYLFIVVFVTIGAMLAFDAEFFAKNQANLDQLSEKFPLLLLFLVPAITMSAWADERRQGTDELLFTLPASDFEVLIGKYLAVLAVYTVSLGFSLTHIGVLAYVGDPDWGVICATYFGYWLAGAALLSAGMFASVLSKSTTVAFVLGTAICSIPVFLGDIAPEMRLIRGLSLSEQLHDFTEGVVPLTGCLYFVSLTIVMLYLNAIMISRRHWGGNEQLALGMQFSVRGISVAAALVATNVLAVHSNAKVNTNIDLTAERVYTLSPATHSQMEKVAKDDQTILLSAYVSREVPQEFEYARKQLVGLLRQYDRLGGGHTKVEIIEVEPLSKEATAARTFGIEPQEVRSEVGGRTTEEDVYLGLLVQSNKGEVVIPFIDTEESVQYQITRSIGTVLREERLIVGVLETDARFMSTGMPGGGWIFDRLAGQLSQQYKLVSVKPEDLADYMPEDESKKKEDEEDEDKKTAEKEEEKDKEDEEKKLDVLIAVLPSTLTETQLDPLVDWVKAGQATLIFDDPWPFFPVNYLYPQYGTIYAAKQKRPAPQTPAAFLSTAPDRSPQLPPQVMQQIQQFRQFGQQLVQQAMEDHFDENPQDRPRFEAKADSGKLSKLLAALDISWDNGAIVSDVYNPHPDFTPEPPPHLGTRWPELFGSQENFYMFIGSGNGNPNALGQDSPITRGLSEVLAFYAGEIRGPGESKAKYKFTPLLQAGLKSVPLEYDDYSEDHKPEVTATSFMSQGSKKRVQRSPLTGQFMRRLKKMPRRKSFSKKELYTVAAHITPKEEGGKGPNCVFVADTDMICEMYFQQQEQIGKPIDNVTFVFNAIEVLAGQPEFAELRSLRPKTRALNAVQAQTDRFREERRTKQKEAEEKMAAELEKAQERLSKKAEDIQDSEGLGMIEKVQTLAMTQQTEQQKFDGEKKRLEKELAQQIQDIKTEERTQIRALEGNIRFFSCVLPPIPAVLIGIIFLSIRLKNERSNISASRRVV